MTDNDFSSVWTLTGPDEYHMMLDGNEYWVYIDEPSGWWACDRETARHTRTQLWRRETKEQLLGTIWLSAVVGKMTWEDAPLVWTTTPADP